MVVCRVASGERHSNFDLKVGLVGPLPPPFGGMGNQTQQLAALLQSEGVLVSLIQTNKDYRPARVARLPIIRAFFRLLPYLSALWRGTGHCDVVHVMANSGWSWHLFAAPAVWIATLRKVPVIVHYHGGEAESFLIRSSSIVRRTMSRAAVLVVPSGFLEAIFARFDMPARVIPNVVDLGRFCRTTTSRPNRRQLFVARNLEPIYDNETAIRAFALVRHVYPDTVLTVAGSGHLLNSLQTLVGELGLGDSVFFTGRLDQDGMVNAYRQADIAINPSLVDNMPGSVLEALACAIPVVSTNVGGIPFILRDGETALLVPPRAPDAMAEAIRRLIDNPGLSQKLIDNGLEEVKKYTWQRVWPLLSGVYDQATKNAMPPA